MAALRAFVGHSFTTDDSALVRKFTDYLDQVSKLVPDFSWIHAEPAEPKQLAEKVITLISDKSLFIGLCTRKEYVVEQADLRQKLMGGRLTIRQNALIWKTSDWIIQEIGIAVGKGLDLILLIENGVREPGGLQGNIEYTPFDRSSPEQAFGKLLEMITALLPRATGTTAASPDVSATSSSEQTGSDQERPDELDWENPKPDWNRIIYEVAYMRFAVSGDETNANRIEQAYLASGDASEGDNRASWEAFCEYRRIVSGMRGSLANLERLAAEHTQSIDVQRSLGLAHEYYQDYQKAGAIYEAATRRSDSGPEVINIAGSAAVAYTRAGSAAQAAKILADLRIKVSAAPDYETTLLRTIHEISEITENKELGLAVLERIVLLDATDIWTRFAWPTITHRQKTMICRCFTILRFHDTNELRWLGTIWESLSINLDYGLNRLTHIVRRQSEARHWQ